MALLRFVQRNRQSTPAIFSFNSRTMDVEITVEKLRAPNRSAFESAKHVHIDLIFGG
jgi:hypothetical protein